jgi:hypothetical protein
MPIETRKESGSSKQQDLGKAELPATTASRANRIGGGMERQPPLWLWDRARTRWIWGGIVIHWSGPVSRHVRSTEHALGKSWHTNSFSMPQEFCRSTRLISLWMATSLEKFELVILQRPSPSSQLQWPPQLRSIATNYGYRFPKEQPPAPRSRNLPSWAGVSLFLDGIEGVSAATRPLKFKSAVRNETRSIRVPIMYGVVEVVMGHFVSQVDPYAPSGGVLWPTHRSPLTPASDDMRQILEKSGCISIGH